MWTENLPPKVALHATRMAEHISMQTHQNAMLMLADPPERPTHFSYKGLPYAFFARFPGPDSHGFIFKIRDLHGMLKFRSKCRTKSPFCSVHKGPKGAFDDPHRAGAERHVLGDARFEERLVRQVRIGPGPPVKLSRVHIGPFLLERPVPRRRDGTSQP